MEYFALGVPELIFIPLKRQEIHLLHRTDEGYTETITTGGAVTFDALPGLSLQAEWILREPRSHVFDILRNLFSV